MISVPVSCSTAHRSSSTTASPGTAPFKLCLELPVPWKFILDHHEWVLLKTHVCNAGFEATFKNLGCLCAAYHWTAHCHCSDKTSLQCLAGRAYMRLLGTEVVKGCEFNERFYWYRELVNSDLCEVLLYVGSFVVRGKHFIVLKSRLEEEVLNPGLELWGGFLAKTGIGQFVVLTCNSCSLRSADREVQRCAYQTRRYIKSMLQHCARVFDESPSRREPGRIIKLRRYFMHSKCLPVFNYFHL